ncbi:MAG: hypothetical protein PF569_04945 [Candidatus Woesearchaeota archaeon]|jgi:hypothetical protein|nr:hypothetical protein [Candidatus Woesearchaeota archaeon]
MENNKIYDTLIIDCNNLYHRAYKGDSAMQTIYNNTKLQTQGISGSLERIQTYIKKYLKEGGKIYFLFDDSNGGEKIDDKLLGYKSNRKKEHKAFYRSLDYLEFILRHYMDNSYILRTPSIEADSWVKPLLEYERDKDKKNLMISTDMDWAGNLSENTHWYSFYNKEIFTISEFENKYKFKPTESAVCFYKSFYGDASDNIEGRYTQMTPKKFNYIIDNFKNMKGFLQGCREKSIEVFNEAIYTRMEREKYNLTTNWELIAFKEISKSVLEHNLLKTKVNLLKLNSMYQALALTIDKRVISSNDVLDNLFEKQYTKRK